MKILRLSWEEKRIRRKIRQVRHMKRMSQSALAAKMQVEEFFAGA